MTDHDRAEASLQQLVNQVTRIASAASAETHRKSAESLLWNALHYGEFSEEATLRLRRLLVSVTSAETQPSSRKLELLQFTVVPTLINLGLAEEA
jgi:hypothetical protein